MRPTARRPSSYPLVVWSMGIALMMGASGCPGPEPDATWAPAFEAESVGWLLNTYSPDGQVRYAVGGTPDATEITGRGVGLMMSDASGDWEPVDLGMTVPLLNWMYGFGPSDLWSVGNAGTILHYDGSIWKEVESPTSENLWGIWGAGPDDLWAVGGSGFPDATATVIRYDGSQWLVMDLPENVPDDVRGLFKVWGSGPDDVYIVGQRGAVLHWDGADLERISVGLGVDLISVWGTGPDRIAMVGGRGNGVLVTWDGGPDWHIHQLAPLPGLNGVWLRDPDTVHVAGVDGVLATIDFDSGMVTESYPDTRDDFHAIFGDASGRLTAVGGNLASDSVPYVGLAYERELANEE